jgi:hypothetical protein
MFLTEARAVADQPPQPLLNQGGESAIPESILHCFFPYKISFKGGLKIGLSRKIIKQDKVLNLSQSRVQRPE